jgi:hypothetical protein
MDTARTSDSVTRVEPPTVEELREKLAQYAIDAQHADLQRHIRQLADAGTQGETKAKAAGQEPRLERTAPDGSS